eukprot:3783615-Amphidinium_carterae.1
MDSSCTCSLEQEVIKSMISLGAKRLGVRATVSTALIHNRLKVVSHDASLAVAKASAKTGMLAKAVGGERKSASTCPATLWKNSTGGGYGCLAKSFVTAATSSSDEYVDKPSRNSPAALLAACTPEAP